MAGWRATTGKPRVTRTAAVVGVAAIVVWLLVVARNPLSRPGPEDVSAPPPSASDVPGNLAVGPYLLWDRPGVDADISVALTSAGWRSAGDGILIKNDSPSAPNSAGIIVFAGTQGSVAAPANLFVYGDACRWTSTRPDAPVATVSDVVAALAAQTSSGPTPPIDVAVGPHSGKAIVLRVPDDLRVDRCDQGELRYFTEGEDNSRSGHVPGQIDELWIVSAQNPAGRVIFDIVYDDTISAGLVDELREMVGSASFK
jgi:hypothetical protein